MMPAYNPNALRLKRFRLNVEMLRHAAPIVFNRARVSQVRLNSTIELSTYEYFSLSLPRAFRDFAAQ